jgi:acetolactate synthase I/II/III large subunit
LKIRAIGIRIEDPVADLGAIARALHVDGFGLVTEPDQLGPALDKAIEIVENGRPAVVDATTQPR